MNIRTAIGLVSITICLALLHVSLSFGRQPIKNPFAGQPGDLSEPDIKNPFHSDATLKNPFLPRDPILKDPFTGSTGSTGSADARLKNPFAEPSTSSLLPPSIKDPFGRRQRRTDSVAGGSASALKDPFAGESAIERLPGVALKNPFVD